MNGWYEFCFARPESGALIEIKGGRVCYLRDIRPETNIAGLFWRYTGIAREMGYGKPPFPAYGRYSSALNLLGGLGWD